MKGKREIAALAAVAIVLAIAVIGTVDRFNGEELHPEKAITTFKDFLGAFNEGNVERMWNMLSVNQREQMAFENFLKVVRKPGEVHGRKIGTLELREATIKRIEGGEVTLVVRILERGAVPTGDLNFPWEDRDFEGIGEVGLKSEGGEWKIDVPVVVNPDPNRPINALELKVEAEPIEVEAGGEITLKFTICSRSPLPIVIHHAHTPARAILYKEENLIAQFPQVILALMTRVLGPFGSENYDEIIPPVYQTEWGLLPTFDEPATYRLAPFAEFEAWWEPGRPTEPHRLQARAIEIKVTGWTVTLLETFNVRFLNFFGGAVGDLSGRFGMLRGDGDVKVKFELNLQSRAEWPVRVQSLTLDIADGFFGFFEAYGPPPPVPPPAPKSITIREGERVILHERTYDVRKLEHPMLYVGFTINSVQAVFSDGQERIIHCGIHPLWHDEYEFPPSIKGMELKEWIEQHFYTVGTDLALELDNRMYWYHENLEIYIKVTSLTDNALDFFGDKYDITFQKWMKDEKRWSGNIFMETEAISLPSKQSHIFSYRVEELAREMKTYEEWMQKFGRAENLLPLPGRYRVVCHNSFAEFWIRQSY